MYAEWGLPCYNELGKDGEKRLGLISYLDVTSEQVPHPVNVECADSIKKTGLLRKRRILYERNSNRNCNVPGVLLF